MLGCPVEALGNARCPGMNSQTVPFYCHSALVEGYIVSSFCSKKKSKNAPLPNFYPHKQFFQSPKSSVCTSRPCYSNHFMYYL